eukprot:UN3930
MASFQRFERSFRSWRDTEHTACTDRNEEVLGRLATVSEGELAAKDCLKAHFADRTFERSALKEMDTLGREQRQELLQVLELVRSHAERFEGTEELMKQIPKVGKKAKTMSGVDIIALLAHLLDITSRSLTKSRKKDEAEADGEKQNGKAKDKEPEKKKDDKKDD